MKKLVTLVAATLLAASPLAFAEDQTTTTGADAQAMQMAPAGTQVADAGTSTDATASTDVKADDSVAKPVKHKKHKKHSHHKKAVAPAADAPAADATAPAADAPAAQ